MNVLMVSTQPSRGGAGRVTELLTFGLRQAGCNVHAFVRDNPDALPTCHQIRHWRVTPMMRWLSRRGLPELGNLTALLWRYLPEFATADVVHLHNLHGEYVSIAALPLWGFDKPLVWSLHDEWLHTGNCAFPRGCTRWRQSCGHCPQRGLYPMADIDRSRLYRWLKPRLAVAARPRLVPCSHWLSDRVRDDVHLRKLPLEVVPNPVPADVFRPVADRAAVRRRLGLDPTAPTVVQVGCLYSDPRKNAADAVVSLRRAAEQVPNLQLLAVGPTSDRLRAETGLPGRALPTIRERDRLAEAYGCGDLCLFPSRADNYPLTVIEAMACGTPVVAYAAGGVVDQVRPLETGLLAADGCVDELAAGVVRLAQSRDLARQLGAAAREFVVTHLSVAAIAARFQGVYGRAIAAWRRRHGGRSPRRRVGAFAGRMRTLLDMRS
jgi:glycosyltransferase involved in cell wall biosynthesis